MAFKNPAKFFQLIIEFNVFQILKRHYNSDVRREDLDAEIYLEKPRQLFWEKRLVGLKPSFDDDNFHPLQMSNIFKAVGQNALISQLESKVNAH